MMSPKSLGCSLAITAFILCFQSFQSAEYSDIISLGISCQTHYDCREIGRRFSDRNCECDSACYLYGDCCVNAANRNRAKPRSARSYTCMQYDNNKGIHVIDECRPGWSGSEVIRRNCEGTSQNLSDPAIAAPTTDTARNVTYKNRYCSECNNAAVENLQTWGVYISCGSLTPFNTTGNITLSYIESNIEYSTRRNAWGVRYRNGSTVSFYNCDLNFRPDRSLRQNVRLCRPNMISRCASGWTRHNVERLCGEYTGTAYTDNGVYRNPHCALCNNEELGKIACSYTLHAVRPVMSFALLLDVNTKDCKKVGQVCNKCTDGKKWDPFFKKCRALVCALPGYSLQNGRCVRD